MTANIAPDIMPRHLLLASDLSARCDRALDRSVQLAQEWHARLDVLNVLDAIPSPEQALTWFSGATDEQLLQVAEQQLARDLSAVNASASLRLARSTDITAAIREAAANALSSLVVTGVSRNETLGRILLGSTVENLARSLQQPLLVVRQRAHGPYRRILVTTDFSALSRPALLTAAKLFPGRELILYHAHSPVMSGLVNASQHVERCIRIEETECAAFLSATALPEGTAVRPVVECGAIESILTRYVREHDIDLVVMGSHGRSGFMSLLLGSTAAKLLDWLPCDTLLVRGVHAAR
ncbi:MAG: universal stress protein [Pseudomonadales bacterium]